MPETERKIYISKETAASIGPAVDHLAEWLGPGNPLPVISPMDFLDEPCPDGPDLDRPGLFSMALRTIAPQYFNRHAAKTDQFLTRQFQHLSKQINAPGIRNFFSGNDYIDGLIKQKTFVDSIHDSYAGIRATRYDDRYLLYINAPPKQDSFKNFFAESTYLPLADMQDTTGTEQEIHSLIIAHEASHFFEQEQLGIPMIENMNAPESKLLQEEITADHFAFYQYKKMLQDGEVRTTELLDNFIDMRALNIIRGDIIHATGPFLALQRKKDGQIITMTQDDAHKLCKACLKVTNTIMGRAGQVFEKDKPKQSYKSAYRAAATLLKEGRFDSCQYQKTYATQFVRALEKHAPSYTR